MKNDILDWQDFITRVLLIFLGFLGIVLFFSAFRFINLFDILARIGLGSVLAVFALAVLRKREKGGGLIG